MVFGLKEGTGYTKGQYDIDQNYTLIIKDVGIEDSATYYCSVAELGTGGASNSTSVKVFGKSEHEY